MSVLKVVKFGGSSLADSNQFRKVRDIVFSDETRKYIVPSAPGKRFPDDIKITDSLYECYNLSSKGIEFDDLFNSIVGRYNSIIDELGLDLNLDDEYLHIKWSISHHAGRDYAASRGEYLSGKILSSFLKIDFIDPSDFIKFDESGIFDPEITNCLLKEELLKHNRAIIPGFYGSMPNGTIKTFSRGGSDITGSIVARAANASLYENWTDVDGFLMADPRIVNNPKLINTITYKELRELSYMGATVLHEDAIFPVRYAGIPINIKNTNNPSSEGTLIVPSSESFDSDTIITGIAGKKGFSVLTIEKDMMNSEIGFGRKVLEVLEKENISFEHLPSGIDTMSIIVNTNDLEKNKDKIQNNLFTTVNPETITLEDGLALIAVVGRGMVKSKGTAFRVFKAASDSDINIKMIDQGSSEINIIIGVSENDFEKALSAIYNEFVK